MRECPWCHHQNLNVYAYCQRCGRGFDGPESNQAEGPRRRLWPFGSRAA